MSLPAGPEMAGRAAPSDPQGFPGAAQSEISVQSDMPELSDMPDPTLSRGYPGQPQHDEQPARSLHSVPTSSAPARHGTGRRIRNAGRWIREQAVFLLVMAGIAATFVFLLVQPGHWRRGTGAMSMVVLGAALLRLVLPDRRAGLLAVRNRWLDAACLIVFGGLILLVDLRLRS